jgi:hypothetical protein
VCNKPVDSDKEHWCHEEGCPNYEGYTDESSWLTCDCDLVAHPWCCPMCKEIDEIYNKPI